jgi:hypothetical protein
MITMGMPHTSIANPLLPLFGIRLTSETSDTSESLDIPRPIHPSRGDQLLF